MLLPPERRLKQARNNWRAVILCDQFICEFEETVFPPAYQCVVSASILCISAERSSIVGTESTTMKIACSSLSIVLSAATMPAGVNVMMPVERCYIYIVASDD